MMTDDDLSRQQDEEFWDDKQKSERRSPQNSARKDEDTSTSFGHQMNSNTDRGNFEAPLPPGGPNLRPKPLNADKSKKKGIGWILWVALLILAVGLGYQGYRLWSNSNADSAALVAPALPPLVDTVALPTVTPVAVVPVAPIEPVVPAGPSPEQIELNATLERLETRLNDVVEGLRAQGYIIGDAGANGSPLPTSAFAPRQVAPPPQRVAAYVRRAPVRKRVPVAPVAKALPPVPRQELLSVDMWDGKPSVVVGSGDPKNGRVKVMQPGDTYNGVTLNSVDVSTQRATFSNGARSVTMDVAN